MKLKKLCPKRLHKPISHSMVALHCAYWGHSTVEAFAHLSYMTPVYGSLFCLTLVAHYLYGERHE